MKNLKVGDTVWVFDINRRVYDGNGLGAKIIYREHFRPVHIIGETSRSWILDYWNRKINKKDLSGIYTSEEEIDKAVWVNDNKHKIRSKVDHIYDYEILKKISEIIGYENEKS